MIFKFLLLFLMQLVVVSSCLGASKGMGEAFPRIYPEMVPAPFSQNAATAQLKTAGCQTCHAKAEHKTMHKAPSVVLGCTDCHGGNANVQWAGDLWVAPEASEASHASAERYAGKDHAVKDRSGKDHHGDNHYDAHGDDHDYPSGYKAAMDAAHILPTYPSVWPGSENPKRSFAKLLKESPEFVRFMNPSDYRVVRMACGACHLDTIEAAERSLMATGAMLWGGASYNNGILPYKNYILGEAHTQEGLPAMLTSPTDQDGTLSEKEKLRGALPSLLPLPAWQVVPPADVFRVFEKGGRNINTQFPEIGLPNATGLLQRLEEPGRPDIRQSNRGPGTGLRVAIPVLNIHKTRLNDPFTTMMGTNDQQGDYRASGCASCHVVYANDREPRHSLTYAKYGRDGKSFTSDVTIDKNESGHPIEHVFTSAIPTSQCMTCHMHQPNIFLNSYLGYTMWDYESDAPSMWPEAQVYPTSDEARAVLDRNPEGAAPRGKWASEDFLRDVYDLNATLKDTQFADYHGHGWNFRAVFKRDRAGNLLDEAGNKVANDDPEKFRKEGEAKFVEIGVNPGKAVHLMSIHAEKGMQCVDCHFSQDGHGNGFIHGEVANAVQIGCKDCHGTTESYPTLMTSNVAAPTGGEDLSLIRNSDGKKRFEWIESSGVRTLIQRSVLDPNLEWEVSLTRDAVDPTHGSFNEKAAAAKLVQSSKKESSGESGYEQIAHGDNMTCYSCHLSWSTSCGGCHLPIEANWKTESHKYDVGETRNFATYNPQVARDQIFQLGRHQTTKGNVIAPIRSTSALLLSSTNINRERIYVQQPPVSAAGFSSQAFAPHFPHTVRKEETRVCSDCHLSANGDNNAIMAQTLLLGTNFINFVGLHSYAGTENGLWAVRVTEYEEPQAVFGSYLHRYAYPDYYENHVSDNDRELKSWVRGTAFDPDNGYSGETGALEEISNVFQRADGAVQCLQHRGEYLYVAEGRGGFRVYDIANIANKSISERIVRAPFSPLGHNAHVGSKQATCFAIGTTQPVHPPKNTKFMQEVNQEQSMHPLFSYAFVTDAEEGLIVVNINTFGDGDPLNNFLERALTWNENGLLDGARFISLYGSFAYIVADQGLITLNIDNPLKPVVTSVIQLAGMRSFATQFRYLFYTSETGLGVVDITDPSQPVLVKDSAVALADARKLYLARTYAYVAAGEDGLAIINIEKPEAPVLDQMFDGEGQLKDTSDIVIGTTNASLFGYVADGDFGFKLLQLTSPSSQPNFYGYSPQPKPEVIGWMPSKSRVLSISKGLDRDRAVDESGNQIAVFGRLGSRPFNREEMEGLFKRLDGQMYFVNDSDSTVVDAPRPAGAN